jgi:hypothetical protein
MKRETSLQVVLATIAHYGGHCTRVQVRKVLRLAGLNTATDPAAAPLSVLHSRLHLINIDDDVVTFADNRARELVHPTTLAWVKALLEPWPDDDDVQPSVASPEAEQRK